MGLQVELFPERKPPHVVTQWEKAYWKCNQDCWMKGNMIRSFEAGKSYVQIRHKQLALCDEQGAFHILSDWDKFFEFDRVEYWAPKYETPEL